MKDLGLALLAEMCPDQPHVFKKANNSFLVGVFRREKPFVSYLVLVSGRAGSRFFKACLSDVSRKYSN